MRKRFLAGIMVAAGLFLAAEHPRFVAEAGAQRACPARDPHPNEIGTPCFPADQYGPRPAAPQTDLQTRMARAGAREERECPQAQHGMTGEALHQRLIERAQCEDRIQCEEGVTNPRLCGAH